jgi:hypothetical protein
MVEQVAAALFQHRLVVDETGRSVCKCGWWVAPLLESVHRLHQSDQVLAAVLMATAQLNAEHVAQARMNAYQDAAARTHAVGLLLANSGDITPVGTRMLDRIWEPAAMNN